MLSFQTYFDILNATGLLFRTFFSNKQETLAQNETAILKLGTKID